MPGKRLLILAPALAALLAGCATTDASLGIRPGADVTRFHLGNPARGSIAIERPTDEAGGLEFGIYAAAVEQQLSALGWTVVTPGQRVAPEHIASVRIERTARLAPRRSGFSIGVGGGGYSGGVGLGGGVQIPIGAGGANQIVTTELSVRLKRRSDGSAIWEGRATAEARGGSPSASPNVKAERLARALFQGFPGESGRTIRVP